MGLQAKKKETSALAHGFIDRAAAGIVEDFEGLYHVNAFWLVSLLLIATFPVQASAQKLLLAHVAINPSGQIPPGYINNSILDEINKSGFIDKLYK